MQRLFRLQNCRSSNPSIHQYSENVQKLSDCKIVGAANQRYPGNIRRFSACKLVLAANLRYPGNIQRLFRLQNCRSSNPSIHQYSENVQKLFQLQNCRSRKSAMSWKHSKIFPPAKMSQQQPINILKMFKKFFAKLSQPQISDILETFKDFSACKTVLAANLLYPGNIQRLFRLQKFLSSNPSLFRKDSKTFSPAKLSQPQISDILKNSKIFPPAKLSQQQPINILNMFKNFFACKNVLAANHLCHGKIQRLFRLQSCLRRKSSISWKYSKTFSPAKISQQQPINILKRFKDFLPAKMSQPYIIDLLEIFKDFFGCKNVLVATHQNSQNIQRLFRLQNCLSSNPSKF